MNKNNHKLAAFTTTELIVVMVLATVVFSLALMAFQIINKQYIQYNQDSTTAIDFDRLQALLHKDIDQAKLIEIQKNQLSCHYQNYTVSYDFMPKQLIRDVSIDDYKKDTFAFTTIFIETSFNQEPIQNGLVDYITWQTQLFEENYTLNLEKIYDHQVLMEIAIYGY